MLNFVNIFEELSFQEKYGIPDEEFGIEYALKDKPLDFQYIASEVVSSFEAVKMDDFGNELETVSLSTSLISYTNGQHICTGLVDYSTSLDCGLYYFLVNSKYQSDFFRVLPTMEESIATNLEISISGLNFQDLNYGIPDIEKIGIPVAPFGLQLSKTIIPLDFAYISDEAISSFKAILLDANYNLIDTITLETSLVTSANGIHSCSGLVEFVTPLDCGIYYFLVNDHFQSDIFGVIDLENDSNCLELFGGGTLELFSGGCLELFG